MSEESTKRTCDDCGGSITKTNESKHFGTKKHKDALKRKEEVAREIAGEKRKEVISN